MLPSEVMTIRDEKPFDYLLMKAKVDADFEWEIENYDIKGPEKIDEHKDRLYRLSLIQSSKNV